MPKKDKGSTNSSRLFLLIFLVVLAVYFFISRQPAKTSLDTSPPIPQENITDNSGLQTVQENLDSVDLDSLEQELNQLNTDTVDL